MICKTKIVKTKATENKMHKNRIIASFLVHLLNCDRLEPVFKNMNIKIINEYDLRYKTIDKYKEVLYLKI